MVRRIFKLLIIGALAAFLLHLWFEADNPTSDGRSSVLPRRELFRIPGPLTSWSPRGRNLGERPTIPIISHGMALISALPVPRIMRARIAVFATREGERFTREG